MSRLASCAGRKRVRFLIASIARLLFDRFVVLGYCSGPMIPVEAESEVRVLGGMSMASSITRLCTAATLAW